MFATFASNYEAGIANIFFSLPNIEIQNLKVSLQIHNIIKNSRQDHRVNKMTFYLDLLLVFFFCQISKENYAYSL